MGTVDALYVMINGGCVPAGKNRNCVCEIAVIWAIAFSMLAPGWKKTLITEMPLSDCDSLC